MDSAAFQQRIEQYSTVRQVIDDLFTELCAALSAEALSYIQYDEAAGELVFHHTLRIERDRLVGIKVPLSQGAAGWVALHGKTLAINDPYSDIRFFPDIDQVTRFQTQNILAAPVLVGGQVWGVLEVLNKRGGEGFSAKDIRACEELAAAFQPAGLDEDELQAAGRQLLKAAFQRVNVAAASLLRRCEGLEAVEFVATENREYDKLVNLRFGLGQGVVGWVAENRQPVRLDDAYSDLRFFQALDRLNRYKTKTILCVPVMHGERLLGVVQCLNKSDGTLFTEQDLAMLVAVCELLAVRLQQLGG